MSATRTRAADPKDIESQLERIEGDGGTGDLSFGRAGALHVSSLGKSYFANGVTKGTLMRYYTSVWPFLAAHVRDRPMVLKRYPDGAGGPMFFQQNAGEHVPDIVRVETLDTRDEGPKARIVGGDLATLLYTVQIGSIEIHPWLSRVGNVDATDRCLIDLDPGDDVPFARVVALARDVLKIIHQSGLSAGVKTSGSSGIHLVIPLPPGVSYEASADLAMLIACTVTKLRPESATVERSLSARPKGTIYVDPMQNARGKSMACAYSVRAKEGAPVSAPLQERELTSRLRLGAFTVKTMLKRVTRVGDLWGHAMGPSTSKQAIAKAVKALHEMLENAPVATKPRRGQKRSVGRR